jgi:OTU domain-containing protein 6
MASSDSEGEDGQESRARMLKRHKKEVLAAQKAAQRLGKKRADEAAALVAEVNARHCAELAELEARPADGGAAPPEAAPAPVAAAATEAAAGAATAALAAASLADGEGAAAEGGAKARPRAASGAPREPARRIRWAATDAAAAAVPRFRNPPRRSCGAPSWPRKRRARSRAVA